MNKQIIHLIHSWKYVGYDYGYQAANLWCSKCGKEKFVDWMFKDKANGDTDEQPS